MYSYRDSNDRLRRFPQFEQFHSILSRKKRCRFRSPRKHRVFSRPRPSRPNSFVSIHTRRRIMRLTRWTRLRPREKDGWGGQKVRVARQCRANERATLCAGPPRPSCCVESQIGTPTWPPLASTTSNFTPLIFPLFLPVDTLSCSTSLDPSLDHRFPNSITIDIIVLIIFFPPTRPIIDYYPLLNLNFPPTNRMRISLNFSKKMDKYRRSMFEACDRNYRNFRISSFRYRR